MADDANGGLNDFFVLGINYKKTDAEVRGKYTINTAQYQQLLSETVGKNVKELFVLSTCNRTEIYGIADSSDELITLLLNQTLGCRETFEKMAYQKQGMEALKHLFSVTAGLDSQILGDYEIVGQIKKAIQFSRSQGHISTFLDRATNISLQCSKSIKTNTELSGGTVSVSFAAIQYLKNEFPDLTNKKILLVGIGKIGRNTCKNLVDYLQTTNITVINRTFEKAQEISALYGLTAVPYENLKQHTKEADIILVATNAESPIIHNHDIAGDKPVTLIDLSIPKNIDIDCKACQNVTLIDLDNLSKIKDETWQKREAEVPKALEIIEEHINEFLEWYEMRRNLPLLKAVREKLLEIKETNKHYHLHNELGKQSDKCIQNVINKMAGNLRKENTKGCQFINAINQYLATGTTNHF